MELNQQTIEEIYKEIRSHKDYMKHAKLQNEYKRRGQWAKAALEGKILKDMEQAVWAEVAKQYIDRTQITMDVVASMSDEDRHKMNILANSIVMLADVLDNLVMDTDSILKKYVSGKNTEFDKLKSALSESKGIVSYFDNKIADEKAADMFGQISDKLYKLIFNQASSYVNKLEKYAEDLIRKLHLYQKWRRGARIEHPLHPKEVGLMIDDCIRVLRKLSDEQVNGILNEKKNL